MRFRKRLDHLTGAEVRDLSKAFHLLKTFAPLRYEFWASIHKVCPHQCGLFLPWHRAYIYAFEEALRDALKRDTVTLPYWDWTADPPLPDFIVDPSSVFFDDRYKIPYDPARPAGARLPTQQELDALMTIPDFDTFGGAGRRLDTGHHGGQLEDMHGRIHQWVGPDMSLATSAAFDPLFWFHHANVDRLWAQWQHTHHENPPCLDDTLDGIPGCWKGRDVTTINTSRLGYAYADVVVSGPRDVMVRADEFSHVRLRLPRPPRPDQRVYLYLEDVMLMPASPDDEQPLPASVVIRAGDPVEWQIERSLFGLMRMPVPMAVAAAEGLHHGMPEHALTLRVDVTPTDAFEKQEAAPIGMRTTTAPEHDPPTVAAITIGQLTIVVSP